MKVPNYLKDISRKLNEKDNEIEVQIVCSCENMNFYVFENTITKEEENNIAKYKKIVHKYNEYYRDKISGVLYLVHRNIFGKIIDKIEAEKLPKINLAKAIKIKCSKCDKQYIIFDNRLYGYNAILNPITNIQELNFMQKRFNSSLTDLVSITIKLCNELSYEEFKIETNNSSLEGYSNSFSSILIEGRIIDLNEKKVVIISEEMD